MTSLQRGRCGQVNSKEDFPLLGKKWSNRRKVSNENSTLTRIRNAQRNDMENIFIPMLLWAICPSVMSLKLLTVLLAARFIHTLVYLLALQPWRALSFVVGLVVTWYMLFQAYFQVASASYPQSKAFLILLLAKMSIMGFPLTAFKRIKNKSFHHGITEDLGPQKKKSSTVDGKPSTPRPRKAVGERQMLAHLDDIFNIVPFVVCIILCMQKQTMKDGEMVELVKYFFYGRLVHSVSVFLGFPLSTLIMRIGWLFSFAINVHLIGTWDPNRSIQSVISIVNGQDKEKLMLALMLKCLIVGIVVQTYRLLQGSLTASDDEL